MSLRRELEEQESPPRLHHEEELTTGGQYIYKLQRRQAEWGLPHHAGVLSTSSALHSLPNCKPTRLFLLASSYASFPLYLPFIVPHPFSVHLLSIYYTLGPLPCAEPTLEQPVPCPPKLMTGRHTRQETSNYNLVCQGGGSSTRRKAIDSKKGLLNLWPLPES